MLSIKSLGTAGSGIEAYYEHLAQDDYYQNGGEPPGQWQGELASELYLFGAVKPGQLGEMFRGMHPLTGEALVSNAGDQHKAGWDLTFSAPKSVSVVWAFATEEARHDVEQAHNKAVAAAILFLEKRAFSSRDRDQFGQPVKSIIAATYQHGTSRELDPQLHTHSAVANIGMRADGTYCALDFDSRYKMAGGAIYRAELSAQLMLLGYSIERDGKSFKITGVDQSICDAFSKRRNQIEERLQQTGYSSAKAASFAALSTRQEKQLADRQSLFHAWQAEAGSLNLDLSCMANHELIKFTDQSLTTASNKHKDINLDGILKDLTAQASTFTLMHFEAAIATESQGVLDANQIENLIKEVIATRMLEHGPYSLVRLKESTKTSRHDSQRFTTREMLEIEKNIIQRADARRTESMHIVSCAKAQAYYQSLSNEQNDALIHITQDQGAVKAVRGLAGTGKSFLLRAAKESWEAENFNVIGAALAGKAAQSLEEGSGIKSQTIHSLLAEIATRKRKLMANDIIVLDEAGMIGSRQMHDVLSHVHAVGAKIVLVGDPLQLQPIDAGSIFRSLSDQLGYGSLTEIRRQELESDREMIHNLIDGKSNDVISSLEERGMLELASAENIYSAIVEKWGEELDQNQMHQSLILAGTKSDVYRINMLAREHLARQHRLHSEMNITTERGERAMAVGERILFTKNSNNLGVKNGQTGSLQKWSLDKLGNIILEISTDAGKSVSVNMAKYNHVEYGYATSVHKAQGQTVDKVYVLASDVMTDREWIYVAASRHRKQLKLFLQEDQKEDLERLINRSRQKDVTQDYEIVDPELQNQSPDFDLELEN